MARRGGRPTIIDIAKQAGVSFKTVSRVLNNDPRVAENLRKSVLDAAAALNYRPNLAARSLAGPRNFALVLLLGIRVSDVGHEDEWYLPAFLSDLQFAVLLASQRAGYRLTIEICDSSDDAPPLALPAGISSDDIDGIIVAPPVCDNVDMIDALDASGIPYVLIAPGRDIENARSVATDEYGGAAAMMRHLLDLGHRRIAFIKGPDGHRAATARLKAYHDVLAAFEGNIEPNVQSGSFNFGSGFQAARELLAAEPTPTAIFCANDDMAAGAIAAATQLGFHVPEQLSICGFDDSAVARLTSPGLTTVRQPLAAMATAAVQLLASIGAQPNLEDHHVTLPYRIIKRASTAAPPT